MQAQHLCRVSPAFTIPLSWDSSNLTTLRRRRVDSRAFGSNKLFLSTDAASTPSHAPIIQLHFYGPDAKGADPQIILVESGTKVLRNIMLDNKLELYDLYGKLMNCGGGGSCGTCIVEVLEGDDLLSKRTDTENRYLKKKPNTWRLSCQTIVGDKINFGKVIIQQLPRKKK